MAFIRKFERRQTLVYGIFSGEYSDWVVHGYFTDRGRAEQYCAKLNFDQDYDEYYVKDISEIDSDIGANEKLQYYHTVIFDFDKGMRNTPNDYIYYIGSRRKEESVYNSFGKNNGWICFHLNADSRKKAEKIAQDKYYMFINKYNETGAYRLAAKAIGVEHA